MFSEELVLSINPCPNFRIRLVIDIVSCDIVTLLWNFMPPNVLVIKNYARTLCLLRAVVGLLMAKVQNIPSSVGNTRNLLGWHRDRTTNAIVQLPKIFKRVVCWKWGFSFGNLRWRGTRCPFWVNLIHSTVEYRSSTLLEIPTPLENTAIALVVRGAQHYRFQTLPIRRYLCQPKTEDCSPMQHDCFSNGKTE